MLTKGRGISSLYVTVNLKLIASASLNCWPHYYNKYGR